MTDFIAIVVLLVVVAAAVRYIYKAKKSGVKCVGCPAGGCCSHKKDALSASPCGTEGEGCCCCHTDENQKM